MLPSVLGPLARHKANILAIVAGQGLAMAGVALGTRVLTECASTATFGTAKLVIGLVTLTMSLVINPFLQFCMRGFHDAVETGKQDGFLRFARRTLFRLAAGAAAVFALGLSTYGAFRGSPSAWTCLAGGLMVIGEAMVTLERGMMITMSRQIAASVITVLQQWGLPLLAAAALLLGGDSVESLVSAQALTLCLLAAGAIAFGRIGSSPELPASRPEDAALWIREARKFAVPMLGMGVLNWVLVVGDRYIIAAQLDVAEVGRYSAVYGLVAAPMAALGTMMSRFLTPVFYRSAARVEVARRRSMRWRMAGVGVLFAAASLVFVTLFGETVVSLLLAEEYRPGAVPLMRWLVVGNGLLIISFAYDTEALARKTTAVLTVATAAAAGANVLVNLALIPSMGIVGAAMATCAAYVVYLATMILLLERK